MADQDLPMIAGWSPLNLPLPRVADTDRWRLAPTRRLLTLLRSWRQAACLPSTKSECKFRPTLVSAWRLQSKGRLKARIPSYRRMARVKSKYFPLITNKKQSRKPSEEMGQHFVFHTYHLSGFKCCGSGWAPRCLPCDKTWQVTGHPNDLNP